MKHLSTLLALAALTLVACDQKPADPKPGDPSSKNAPAASDSAPAAAQPVTIADGDLSTPADFEETAEKAITKANYKTELATLETDIAKE